MTQKDFGTFIEAHKQHQANIRLLHQVLKKQSGIKLTLNHVIVLHVLYNRTQYKHTRRIDIVKATELRNVSGEIQELVLEGYVRRGYPSNPGERRSIFLYITEDGIRIYRNIVRRLK